MKHLKLGIIGFGFMGQWHNNHAGTMEEVDITAICDMDPAKLEKAEGAMAKYEDYHDLLKDPNVEWVMISVPNHLHRQVALDEARAKKHMIVEKPCALNVAEFDEMYRAAQDNGVLFTVDQNRRWDRDYSVVKKVLEEGKLGNLYMIRSSHYGVFGKMHDWHVYPECGGGMLYDWGVHLIDQMLELIPGRIVRIAADMKEVVNEVDDYFKLWFYFDHGLTAEIELGTLLLKHMPRWYVSGDQGTLVVENIKADEGALYFPTGFRPSLPETAKNLDAGPTRTFSSKPEEAVREEPIPEVKQKHNDWNDFFRNVIGVINGTEEMAVKPEQVRRVLQVMELVRRAGESRTVIECPEGI